MESGVSNMQFFNVKTRKKVDVPDRDVTVTTMKNGRKAAKVDYNGMKLFKILSKEDQKRLRK